ncbi:hypothetical protein WBG78_24290 [Chryseolinea sp. T2]|uniref:hypothetical protein n=1 Tax=Chryseolinea sp. T2 TaxID=3129255 RepID=UPI003076E81F
MHPTVLLFTGHLLDSIDRISARFPYRLISEVRRMIAQEVRAFQSPDISQIAVSSLAAGGDILFAEAIVEAGIPLHIFLSHPPDEFVDRSVQYAKNHHDENENEWLHRFASSMDQAVSISIVDSKEGEDPYVACNREMLRHALQFSNNETQRILALAMMETESEVKQGGTADFALEIESNGIPVRRLWPHRPHRLYR